MHVSDPAGRQCRAHRVGDRTSLAHRGGGDIDHGADGRASDRIDDGERFLQSPDHDRLGLGQRLETIDDAGGLRGRRDRRKAVDAAPLAVRSLDEPRRRRAVHHHARAEIGGEPDQTFHDVDGAATKRRIGGG
jgi:hypothetical protein